MKNKKRKMIQLNRILLEGRNKDKKMKNPDHGFIEIPCGNQVDLFQKNRKTKRLWLIGRGYVTLDGNENKMVRVVAVKDRRWKYGDERVLTEHLVKIRNIILRVI